MCRPKTGEAVKDWQDTQNLVTGIIFRQRYKFSRQDLISNIARCLQGSDMSLDQERVTNIIDSTLSACVDKNWLIRSGDMYDPENL